MIIEVIIDRKQLGMEVPQFRAVRDQADAALRASDGVTITGSLSNVNHYMWQVATWQVEDPDITELCKDLIDATIEVAGEDCDWVHVVPLDKPASLRLMVV